MNSILVLKLHGLQVSKSFKLKYTQNIDIYLYPKDYFERLSEIDTFLEKIKSLNVENNNLLIPTFLRFEIGNDKTTYLIIETSIDVYQDDKELIREVREILELFLRLNSFIFEFTIDIQKIFLFLKQEKEYRLIRIIDRRIVIDKNDERILKYQLDNYNTELQLLFDKINNSDLLREIVKILYEFIVASNNSEIESKIIYYWNYIEHIAQIYASHQNRNLLIDIQKYERIKEGVSKLVKKELETISLNPLNIAQIEEKVKGLFNKEFNKGKSLFMEKTEWNTLKEKICVEIQKLLENSDILIDGYDKVKISELLIKYLDNFPPSEKLIELMLNDIGYETNENEKLISEYMKVARNYLFHTSLRLGGLFQRFIDEYNKTNFDFNELINIIRKFKEFLEKVTAQILRTNIMEDKRPSEDVKWVFRQPFIEKSLGKEETFIDMVKLIRESFLSNRDYEGLIKIVIEKDDICDRVLQHTTMKGYCFDQEYNRYFKFDLEFLNKYKAQGKFDEGISSPQIYKFYIDLKKNNLDVDLILKFKEIIRLGFFLRPNYVFISVLDFWFDKEKINIENERILNLLNDINYFNH